MDAGIDFMSLKYQAQPHLVIEECLKADDPSEEVAFAMFALSALGHMPLAERVMNLCPRYGIIVDLIETEARY
jgi:hypothetical protein